MTEYDAWAPVYDAWSAHMTEDVAHYVSLAREADGPIVEIAREGAAALPIELRLGDMRDLELEEPAGLIIDVAGLEVEALYGGFEREPLTEESMELVYATRKP